MKSPRPDVVVIKLVVSRLVVCGSVVVRTVVVAILVVGRSVVGMTVVVVLEFTVGLVVDIDFVDINVKLNENTQCTPSAYLQNYKNDEMNIQSSIQ